MLTILLVLQLTASPAQQNRFPPQQQLQSARFPSFSPLETQQLGQQQVRSAYFGLILSFIKKEMTKVTFLHKITKKKNGK
jgi:hypothetical protein